MAIVLALISALSYGISDFLGGLASRSWDSRRVTLCAQTVSCIIAAVAVLIDGGAGPSVGPLAWGAAAGVGSAVGLLSLYRAFARGSMGVVAPVCGVITTVLPALIGVALGDRLDALQVVGIVLALPAVGLVSREGGGGASRAGVPDAALAGVAFGGLFVALDRAGGRDGTWPLLADLAVGLVIVSAVVWRARSRVPAVRSVRPELGLALVAGLLGSGANLFYVFATHHGELAIVGVLSSLYPAGTVLMAWVWLSERWNRLQVGGMFLAILAVALVAVA